jgi:hypothetical protein
VFDELVDIACESDQARTVGWEVRQDIVRGIETSVSGGLVPFDGVDAPCAIRGGTPNLAITLLLDAVPGGQAPAVQEDADPTRMTPWPCFLRIKGQDIAPISLRKRDVGKVHGLGRETLVHPGPHTLITVSLHVDGLPRLHRGLAIPQAFLLLHREHRPVTSKCSWPLVHARMYLLKKLSCDRIILHVVW